MRGWHLLLLGMGMAASRALGAPATAPADYRFAPGDVIEVSVRQKDRSDVDAPLARGVDDQLRLEVGVDDDGVMRRLVFDQVGVGAESPIGGDLDPNLHKALRTTTYGPVSRCGSKPARRYMLNGPR